MKKSLLLIAALSVLPVSAAGAGAFEPALTSAPDTSMAARVKQMSRPLSAKASRNSAAPVKKSPLAATAADGTKIYGGVVYADSWSSSNAPYGIYSSTTTAPLTVEQHYLGDMFRVNGGGFYAGGKYYFIDYTISSTSDGEEQVFTYLYENETSPFRYVGQKSLGMSHIAKDLTFDPIDQRVYGIFSVGSLEDSYLIGAMDLTDYRIEEFCRLPITHVAIAADRLGNVYTISCEGDLYRLDKSARELKPVGPTGVGAVEAKYAQSATIDLNTGVFYWAALHTDGSSALYTVDTATGTATKVGDFPDNEEFAGIYIPDVVIPAAPAAAEELYPDFPDGSLSGVVAFDAPKYTQEGILMSGDISFVLSTNGVETHRGTVRAGKRNYEIEMTLPDNGFYTFSLTLSNDAGSSYPTALRTYIGNDFPEACTEATAVNTGRSGKIDLKWRKPRKGVNNGYVDFKSMTYNVVRLPDNVQVASALADTVFTDNIEDTSLRCYRYRITAAANGMEGAPVLTNKVAVGHIAQVPYVENFDTEVDFSTWSVDDADNDAALSGWSNIGTWDYSAYKGGVATATPAGGNNAGHAKNDWLFTPPVHLRADRTYKVKYLAMSQGNRIVPSFREYMEVKMGNAPTVEAMTETLLENCEIDNEYTKYNSYDHVIHVDEEGEYHIGFHATTPGDQLMWNLVIDDVEILEDALCKGPAAVTDFTVTPGENGAQTASVSFKAPEKAIDGSPLEALDRIEILRGSDLIKTFTAPAPGASLEFVDDKAPKGTVEYRAVPYDAENKGLEAKARVFIGYDIPAEVKNVQARDVDGVVTVTWEAPGSEGVTGNYVDVSKLTYTVERYLGAANSKIIAENITALTVTDPGVTADEQTQVAYRVTASNSEGKSKAASSEPIFVGGDDNLLPVHESFPGRYSTSTVLRYITSQTGSQWGVADEISGITPADADGGMAVFGLNGYALPGEDGLQGMLYTNRISIEGAVNPAVSCYIYHEKGSANVLDIMVNRETEGWKSLRTIPVADPDGAEGWIQIVVPLADFKGSRYIQVGFRGTAKDESALFIDNILIDDLLDHNVELTSISSDRIAAPGVNLPVSVTVTNRGLNPTGDYSVVLSSAAGDFTSSLDGPALAPGNSAEVKFEFPVTLGTPEENTLTAEVVYEPDMKVSDNVSESVDIYVELPRMAYVTDLRAEKNSDGSATLAWSAPDASTASPEPVTDNFDSYKPFIIDNIGTWKMYDGDGRATWGISNGQGGILNYTNAGKPMAWQVFSPTDAGLSVNYDPESDTNDLPDWRPYSGSKMMISYAPVTGASDDWMISEELTGSRQIVSLMGRGIVSRYNEKIEILASQTGREPEDFTRVAVFSLSKVWTRLSALLPEGTRYFAIRCISPQQFAAIVDDVVYAPAGSAAAAADLTGYNIYRDGEKVATAPAEGLSWNDEAAAGVHTYRVSAVYNLGESRLSNEAKVGESGIGNVGADSFRVSVSASRITVTGSGDADVMLYGTDGRLAGADRSRSGKAVFTVAPGVYIVRAGSSAVKVAVM